MVAVVERFNCILSSYAHCRAQKEPNTASISYLSSSLGVADPLTTSSYTGPFGTARTTKLHIQKDISFFIRFSSVYEAEV